MDPKETASTRILAPSSGAAEIRASRQRVGLTLRETARRAGISPSHLSGIETGKEQPSTAALFSLMDVIQRERM